MAKAVNRPHRDARDRPARPPARRPGRAHRRGARPRGGRRRRSCTRSRASSAATASPCPCGSTRPTVRAADLTPVAAQVRTALARPVRMQLGGGLVVAAGAPARGDPAAPARRREDACRRRARRDPLLRPARPRDRQAGARRHLQRALVAAASSSCPRGPAASSPPARPAATSSPPRSRRRPGTARVVVTYAQPNRSTAQAKAMGITTRVGRYETIYGGDPNRIHNVQLVAHLVDGKLIAPGATFSFNQATGERTADKGFREAPVIINGELTNGPRRRRLPGLDDGLQRRLRGWPEDHRADEPRALHQPLPAGPRRDGQLPGRRPEVRQRHGALAAAAHLRRLVLARRRALRRAAEPARRERDRSRSSTPGTRRSKRVPDPALFVGQTSVEESGEPRAVDERRAQGLHERRARCSTTTRGTRPTAASRASSTSGRSRGRQAAAEEEGPDAGRAGRPARPASALRSADRARRASRARASAGACVASTQAWRVQPSAIVSPSRSTE